MKKAQPHSLNGLEPDVGIGIGTFLNKKFDDFTIYTHSLHFTQSRCNNIILKLNLTFETI